MDSIALPSVNIGGIPLNEFGNFDRILHSINRFILNLNADPDKLLSIARKYAKKKLPKGNIIVGARYGTNNLNPFRCRDAQQYSFMLGFKAEKEYLPKYREPAYGVIWLGLMGINSLRSEKDGVFHGFLSADRDERLKAEEHKKNPDYPVIVQLQGSNPRGYDGGIVDSIEQRLTSEILASFRWEAFLVNDVAAQSAKEAGYKYLYLKPADKRDPRRFHSGFTLEHAKRRYNGIARRCHF